MKIQSSHLCHCTADSASQTQRMPRTSKSTAPKQVSQNQPVQAAPAAVEAKPTPMNPRLAAYADNINTRLSQAISNTENTPRQKAALEATQAHFQSMVSRLDQAFFAEGRAKVDMTPGQGMNKIIAHLSGAVTTVMTHGKVDVQA